jgi:Flp pilus assembly secretin CpaC
VCKGTALVFGEAGLLSEGGKSVKLFLGAVAVLSLGLSGAVVAPAAAEPAAEPVQVQLDQARIVRLPDRVATLIIGNPSIADGTLQTGGLLVVTGKSYGNTNIISLDARGNVLAEHSVTVGAPKDNATLAVWRGVARETWSCAPRCERSVMLGDAPEYFNPVIGQVQTRNGHAAGQSTAAAK